MENSEILNYLNENRRFFRDWLIKDYIEIVKKISGLSKIESEELFEIVLDETLSQTKYVVYYMESVERRNIRQFEISDMIKHNMEININFYLKEHITKYKKIKRDKKIEELGL